MTAQQNMNNIYGGPGPDYVRKHCIRWLIWEDFGWFPVGSFLVNVDFKKALHRAFSNLQAAGLHREIKTFDGCYSDRDVRGSAAISLHAWAAAIDLNAACDGMVEHPTVRQRMGEWSPEFIQIMKEAGLFYGGDFISRADPMHWAMFDG
jgi:hypothetical protein